MSQTSCVCEICPSSMDTEPSCPVHQECQHHKPWSFQSNRTWNKNETNNSRSSQSVSKQQSCCQSRSGAPVAMAVDTTNLHIKGRLGRDFPLPRIKFDTGKVCLILCHGWCIYVTISSSKSSKSYPKHPVHRVSKQIRMDMTFHRTCTSYSVPGCNPVSHAWSRDISYQSRGGVE